MSWLDFFRNPPGELSDVSTPSAERKGMDADLQLISDIRAGSAAIRRRSAIYLPKYEMESADEYARRVKVAPWRPEFVDALAALASKPFSRDVRVGTDTPPQLRKFAEDVDGRGSNLTRFARQVLTDAIADGMTAVLCDFPNIPPLENRLRSLAEENAIGARPYLISIPLCNIISLRTEIVAGREMTTHLRYWETSVEPDGFGEKVIDRIRLIEPGRWELWEQDDRDKWRIVDQGRMTLPEVPLALLFTGQRTGTLRVRPPLLDLAEMNIELFRAMSRLDETLTYAGSPMLCASGVAKPKDDEPRIVVGPKSILFAPPTESGNSKFEYISPDAGVLGEIRQQVGTVSADMRRLGMQPNVPQSGTITATATSVEAAKAHSALEAWALALKDTLERAFQYAAQWQGINHATTIEVFTDFAVGDQNTAEATVLLTAQKQAVISAQTARDELKRRNILGPEFDEEDEQERIATETAGLDPEEEIDPVTGKAA